MRPSFLISSSSPFTLLWAPSPLRSRQWGRGIAVVVREGEAAPRGLASSSSPIFFPLCFFHFIILGRWISCRLRPPVLPLPPTPAAVSLARR